MFLTPNWAAIRDKWSSTGAGSPTYLHTLRQNHYSVMQSYLAVASCGSNKNTCRKMLVATTDAQSKEKCEGCHPKARHQSVRTPNPQTMPNPADSAPGREPPLASRPGVDGAMAAGTNDTGLRGVRGKYCPARLPTRPRVSGSSWVAWRPENGVWGRSQRGAMGRGELLSFAAAKQERKRYPQPRGKNGGINDVSLGG